MTKNNKKGAKLASAIAYIRIASYKDRKIVDMQFDSFIEYAKQNEYKIVKYYVDLGVGSGQNKGTLEKIAKLLKVKKCKRLLVRDMTRISRNISEGIKFALKLKKQGVAIECIGN